MIIVERDIDDFVSAYRKVRPYDVGESPTWSVERFFRWLSNNPQVVVASGYQEFVAGAQSPIYQTLVGRGELDNLQRPLLREYKGRWIVPTDVGDIDREPWDACSLGELLQLSAAQAQLDEEWLRGDVGPADYDEWQAAIDDDARFSLVPMPSFEAIVGAASKFVGNPLVNETLLVSPRLWTPQHQSFEKEYLHRATGNLLRAIKDNKLSLSDLTWRQLEEIVAEVLRGRGMEIHVVRENPQGGRDIIARSQVGPMGEVFTIAVEVKHRKTVDRPILQGAIHQNRHFPALMLVTSGRFTAGVIKEASRPENRMRVVLRDGVAIREMISMLPLSDKPARTDVRKNEASRTPLAAVSRRADRPVMRRSSRG